MEFSLTIIPLFAFLFLIMNVAWIIFAWACIQEGAREGVRYGIAGQVSTGLDAAIRGIVNTTSMGFASKGTVSISYYAPSNPSVNLANQPTQNPTSGGNILQVTVTLPLMPFLPFWQSNGTFGGKFIRSPITLVGTSSDVMETLPPGQQPVE